MSLNAICLCLDATLQIDTMPRATSVNNAVLIQIVATDWSARMTAPEVAGVVVSVAPAPFVEGDVPELPLAGA